jgi:hypothetical protein
MMKYFVIELSHADVANGKLSSFSKLPKIAIQKAHACDIREIQLRRAGVMGHYERRKSLMDVRYFAPSPLGAYQELAAMLGRQDCYYVLLNETAKRVANAHGLATPVSLTMDEAQIPRDIDGILTTTYDEILQLEMR